MSSHVSAYHVLRLRRHLDFVLLGALSLVLWWRPLIAALKLAFSSEGHTHILLILPLGCALIFQQRKGLPSSPGRSVGAGSTLLALSLLIACFARYWASGWPEDVRLSLSMFALVTWWIASVVFCFGIRVFHSVLFPLCFLFWMVPIPEFVLEEIIYFLQQHSALAARVLFMAAGVPVTQDGIMLFIPGLDIEVARQCSSIRSSLMLLITTMVLGHLFLGSWWRKALLIVAAIPLAAVKNGFRIFTISELGTRVDPAFFEGRLHHQGGIVFLAISFSVVAALLWVLRRTETHGPQGLRAAALK